MIVSDSGELLPKVTFPKLRLGELGASCPGEVPVPDNGNASDGLEASEVIVTVPVAVPADCGANVTLKVMLWEGFRVSGAVIPLRRKPVPLTAACEMLTLVPPLLVSVTVWDCWVPVITLPKFSLDWLSPSCPAETPVPERPRLAEPFEALLVTVTEALNGPVAFGANKMPNEVL